MEYQMSKHTRFVNWQCYLKPESAKTLLPGQDNVGAGPIYLMEFIK